MPLPAARPDPVAPAERSRPEAAEQYFILADISGYTAFLASVEDVHGVDFSLGVPAGYEILAALLDVVVDGLRQAFKVAKIEGDAVFGLAPAASLDGAGDALLRTLNATNEAFAEVQREQAAAASDHLCTACPVASTLWLKMIVHRGVGVHVSGGSHAEVHGPAVTLVHRLLKNGVTARIGPRPYLLLTAAAAAGLGLDHAGIEHREEYIDAASVVGRVLPLG